MSRQLKRQILRAQAGRGARPSPTRPRPARTREQRLNRILLLGGAGFAIGAVVLALLAPRFEPVVLAFNLVAIGLGLLMGRVIGGFIFRRIAPTGK
jgi:hypothetical protein